MTNVLTVGELQLNRSTHEVSYNGQKLVLDGTGYRILEYFMQHGGDLVAGQDLLTGVWGEDPNIDMSQVYSGVKKLRAKLEKLGSKTTIETVKNNKKNAGYVLK